MRTVFFLSIIVLLAQFPTRTGLAWGALPHGHDGSTASQGLVITSDSAAYCAQLSAHLREKMRLPRDIPVGAMEDARSLQATGQSLCDEGRVRAGIVRLRRALVLLKHQERPHQ